MPSPPPALVGMEAVRGYLPPGALCRVAQDLGLTLAEVDARMSVLEVLDECDRRAYLHDVDNPPQAAPTSPSRR